MAKVNWKRLTNRNPSLSERRIFIDITTAARTGALADGITRVIRELMRYALNRSDTEFVVFDSDSKRFKIIDRRWLDRLAEGKLIIDLPNFEAERKNKGRSSSFNRWVSHPRKQAFLALEGLRLRGGRFSQLAARFQLRLMNAKYRRDFIDSSGGRLPWITIAGASSEYVSLRDNDVLVLCGSDWQAMNYFLTTRGPAAGHVVVLCYDIIPILFPQYVLPKTAQQFALCFDQVCRVANLVVFISEAVRRDALSYCQRKDITLQNSSVVLLGSTPLEITATSSEELPAGLETDRYILFVSTIEPRKGHAMMLSIWKRLIEIPSVQTSRFKLAFVGRKGWLVDDLYTRFSSEPCVGKTLNLLSNIDDRALAQLYKNAAFCVFPSIYEGFGLPIVESFRYGKAVIASNGGALPEVAGAMAPCLDPRDEDLWFETMLAWIENPQLQVSYETAIRSWKERSWSEVGLDFFNAVERL